MDDREKALQTDKMINALRAASREFTVATLATIEATAAFVRFGTVAKKLRETDAR